jgi:hypothetical protein
MDQEKTPASSPVPPASHGAHHLLSQPLTELHPMALLQPWIDFVPQQQRRLGLFICLALAVHAAVCFFLVIDTSVAQMRREPHLYVSVDSPQALAASGQADPFWDQVTDPRVFLLPRSFTADLNAGLPPLTVGSALGSGALPPPAPPETFREAQPAVPPLEQQVAAAMVPPRQPFVYAMPQPPVLRKTAWHWDGALALRHPAAVPDLPTLVSDTNVTPTRLRVSINSDGTVADAVVEPISDDLSAPAAGDVDEQAVEAARKIRFDPVSTPGLQWGRVTIFWNYAPKPREEVVPTPPAPGP